MPPTPEEMRTCAARGKPLEGNTENGVPDPREAFLPTCHWRLPMDPFYSTSGSSPPEEPLHRPDGHEVRPEEQESPSLPEEFIEALAALLATALVNDIRQHPNLRDLTSNGTPVAGADTCPQPSARHRRISTRSSTRRPAHAS